MRVYREHNQRAEERKQERKRRAEERKRRAENAESLEHLTKMVDGVGHRVGAAIVDFFAFALTRAMPVKIKNIQFDEIFVNKEYTGHGREMQCDIVLMNKEYIAILETWHFLESLHIDIFSDKLNAVLPLVLPEQYRRLRVVPVMACMDLSKYAAEKAREHGIVVMRPDGQKARINAKHLRIRAPGAASRR